MPAAVCQRQSMCSAGVVGGEGSRRASCCDSAQKLAGVGGACERRGPGLTKAAWLRSGTVAGLHAPPPVPPATNYRGDGARPMSLRYGRPNRPG
eukprot:1121104-Prymnesium_polylepis.1